MLHLPTYVCVCLSTYVHQICSHTVMSMYIYSSVCIHICDVFGTHNVGPNSSLVTSSLGGS